MFEPKHLNRWTMPDSYFGEVWPDYYSAGVGRSRDSDALERSNFDAMVEALDAVGFDDPDYDDDSPAFTIVRESHWAVGWVEWIAIHADAGTLLQAADKLAGDLADYPVIDECKYSEYEQSDADETWRNCFNVRERIDYIRENRAHIEARGFADLLGCVRGEYFLGYASELLY